MKLSFSTRGWDEYNWERLVDAAEDMGFSGIEVYDLLKHQRLIDKGGPFDKYLSLIHI